MVYFIWYRVCGIEYMVNGILLLEVQGSYKGALCGRYYMALIIWFRLYGYIVYFGRSRESRVVITRP